MKKNGPKQYEQYNVIVEAVHTAYGNIGTE